MLHLDLVLKLWAVVFVWIVAEEDIASEQPRDAEQFLLLKNLPHLFGIAQLSVGAN